MTETDRVWFTLDTAAKPVGPYTVEEITGWAAAGYVSEAQVFWKEGNSGWDKSASIPELALVHKALQDYQQQHPGHQATAGSHPHPHVKVISAKPSDPLDAFKHEIEAVEQAGPAEDDPAATDAAADYREGMPEELEFEDDDGTVYLWDPKLRKYMPAGEAAAENGAAAVSAAGDGYDMDAMTFVTEEEVIPTIAAVKAAEEAAAAVGTSKNKKRAGDGGEGQAGKKAKPSDSTAAATADTDAGPMAAADGATAAAAGAVAKGIKGEEQQPPGWFELKKNTSVYVTGLPDDTDADEVAGVFAKCGIIKLDDAGQPRIKLYRDKQSGMLKGDGLITYLKAPSVQLACQILDGTPLRAVGPNMSVSEAKFEMKGQQYQDKRSGAAAGATKQRQKSGGSRGGRGGSKSGRGRGRGRAPGIQEKLERKLGWGGFDDLLPPEKVTVVLKGLFTPDEAADGGLSFVTDLEADVTAECKKLGTIEKVRVFAQHPEGVVTVRFKQAEPAEACVSLMDGRFFGGNKLAAHMWDGFTQYHGVKVLNKETAEEQEARLEAFARELEAKQQQRQQEQRQEAAEAEAEAIAMDTEAVTTGELQDL